MSKYRLALADSESEYVFALTNYILNHYREQISVAAFTKPEALENYLENTSPEVLIAGAEFEEKCIKAGEKTKLWFFDNEEGLSPAKGETVTKYQAADELLKVVFAELSGNGIKNSAFSGKGTHIHWVYSPAQNQLLQPFAYTLAANVARDKATLLINICENAAFDWMFQKGKNEDLSNVFYLLEQGKSMVEILKRNSLLIEGIEIIAPMKNAWNFCELSTELWQMFWRELIDQTMYEEVVIVSDSIRPAMGDLLDEINISWILSGGGDYELARCREFIEELEVKVPEGMKINKVVLPYVRTSCRGEQAIRQWLYGELGDEIRKYI